MNSTCITLLLFLSECAVFLKPREGEERGATAAADPLSDFRWIARGSESEREKKIHALLIENNRSPMIFFIFSLRLFVPRCAFTKFFP